MSIRARMRASRRVCPISGTGQGNLVASLVRVVWNGHRFGRRLGVLPLAQVGDVPLHVGFADQHLARLGALVARDHAAPLEHVDQAARPRIAEPQAALEHRGRGGLHLGHEADGLLEQRVLVGEKSSGPLVSAGVSSSTSSSRSSRISGSPCLRQNSVSFSIWGSSMYAPWIRWSFDDPMGEKSMSPLPSSDSAPFWSRITRESVCEPTAKAIRDGTLALIMPVITSTRGDCVASTRWIPTARAFWARRMIESSTSAGATIIRSASSSMTHRM